MRKIMVMMALGLVASFAVMAYAGVKFGNGAASQATTASYINWTGVSGTEQFSSAGTMTNVVLDDNGNVISSTTGLGDVYRVFGWRYVTVQWKGVYSGWYNYSTASGKTAGHAHRFGGYSSISPGTFKLYAGPTANGPWSLIYVGSTAQSYTGDGAITIPNSSNYMCVSYTRSGSRALDFYVTPGSANNWP
ncbi:MAG: hypothetical protein WA666_02335 [Nitrospirota bacterium]